MTNIAEIQTTPALTASFLREFQAQANAQDEAESERLSDLAFSALEAAIQRPIASTEDASSLAGALQSIMAGEDEFTPYPAADRALEKLLDWIKAHAAPKA